MRRQFAVTAILLLTVGSFAGAANWQIDPAHSAALFKVRHMMISSVTGEFGKIAGAVNYDPADPAKSTVEVTIDTTSLNTRVADRDNHLKSPDFFDVAKFPTMTFKSKRVEKAGDVKLKVTGDLTLRGVTKEVALEVDGPQPEVKDPWGNVRTGASATTRINRQDFGVSWNKTMDGGGLVVGDEVTVTIDLEMIKQK